MTTNWLPMVGNIILQSDEIQLLRVHTPAVISRYNDFWQILSNEERERASRFYFAKDREQSVCARAILRLILAPLLNLDASKITFNTTKYGKLYLPHDINTQSIQFNLSHSHEIIVYALTLHTLIGVDVEYPKHNIDYDGIAKRFFSSNECKQLKALLENEKQMAFYNAWTRKEAYIKAIGEGLSHPLDTFDVTLLPHEPARLTRLAKQPELLAEWTLDKFTPFHGYYGAYALRQKVKQTYYWDWR